MESWNVAICKHDKEADYYLINKNRTPIKFTTKVPFNMGKFLSMLENVKFPLKYTDGIEMIKFRRIPNFFGLYGGNIVEIGAKPKRQMSVYVETFIHEVAHHLDSDNDVSHNLNDERRRRGHYIIKYTEARNDNSEYFARGFEMFYSSDPGDRKKLRKCNPRLHRIIARLHKKYSSR